MKNFKSTIEAGTTEKGTTIIKVVEIEANNTQDAKFKLQQKFDLHYSQVSVFSNNLQTSSLEELKEKFETKINEATHQDFRDLKKKFNLKNSDVAEILGLTVDSVKTLTQPNKELPTWAKAMIYVWKKQKE